MSSARHAAAAHGAQAAAPAGGGHAAALRERLRLYLVTDEASLRGRTLADVVLAAIDGGVTCVQIREKRLDARDFYAKARALMELLAPRAIPLVVNDRVDIALARWKEGADRYFVCRATLDRELVAAAPAFEEACRRMTVVSW